VLKTLAKVMAPFAPFAAEDIWLKLRNEKEEESVHLTEWPKAEKINSKILEKMETLRAVVTKGLELRQKAGIKIRQPLQSFTFEAAELKEYYDIVKDELNIKEIKQGELALDTNISPELKQEGDYRELVRALQDMRKKMGLTPSDVVSIFFETDETGKKLVQKFEPDMKKTVLVSRIEFKNNDGEAKSNKIGSPDASEEAFREVKIDSLIFKVKIEKI
jgi:isoleucyl-tRNA synthetase